MNIKSTLAAACLLALSGVSQAGFFDVVSKAATVADKVQKTNETVEQAKTAKDLATVATTSDPKALLVTLATRQLGDNPTQVTVREKFGEPESTVPVSADGKEGWLYPVGTITKLLGAEIAAVASLLPSDNKLQVNFTSGLVTDLVVVTPVANVSEAETASQAATAQ